MANTVTNVQDHGEFWRPPLESRQEATPQVQSESCARCGTEFVAGSQFCHVCGGKRQPGFGHTRFQWVQSFELQRMQEWFGLPLVSLLAFVVGVICGLAAIGTGLVFTAATVLDWQAVQVWRIEWLLAAVAAFLVSILLRNSGGTKRKEQ